MTLILRDDIIILCQQTVNGDRVVAWSYNRLWKMLIDKKMKRTDLLCIYQHENIIPYPARFQSTLPMRGATLRSLSRMETTVISIHAPHEGSDVVVPDLDRLF